MDKFSWNDVDKLEVYSEEALYEQYKRSRRNTVWQDSRKGRLYKAEWASQKVPAFAEANTQFASYDEAEAYMKKVLRSSKWRKLNTDPDYMNHNTVRTQITLIKKKDMGYRSRIAGTAWRDAIQLCPSAGLNKYTLLHELAHSIGNWDHKRRFRRVLIQLVDRFMGGESAKILKLEMRKRGLVYAKKRAPMSQEQYIATCKRLKSARKKSPIAKGSHNDC